jgi:integrase
VRGEALLALLIYTGLRAQEACDVQIRDLDLEGGTLTVRHGKGGRMRRVMLNAEAIALLRRYLHVCAVLVVCLRLAVGASVSRCWRALTRRKRVAQCSPV